MKLAQFKAAGSNTQRVGILIDGKLVDLAVFASAVQPTAGQASSWLLGVTDTSDIIRRGEDALIEISALVRAAEEDANLIDERLAFAVDEAEFLPPVIPGKILAIGRNYIDHAIEGGSEPPAAPLIFNKLPNSLSAHNAPIVLPAISSQVDYEAELAVVIGRRAKRVGEAEALDYVFGYSLINDVSARDLQFGDGQWVRGKGLDGFAPVGPFVTTRDEVADVQALRIEGRLNGETMQSSNTSRFIFDIPELIATISEFTPLHPGDVVLTGTPEGVGFRRDPQVLLRDGDELVVEVERVGRLENPVALEPG